LPAWLRTRALQCWQVRRTLGDEPKMRSIEQFCALLEQVRACVGAFVCM
jgi:hypothetical protein